MKPKVRLNFSDFWPNFDNKDNFFYHLLSTEFDIELADQPDFLIYSVFGDNFRQYNCIRILYTGENIRPNFFECDYSFSFDYSDYKGRNYRLPLYALYGDVEILTRPKPDFDTVKAQKTKFCCMVVSKNNCQKRSDFFWKISKYKRVDSGGKLFNNVGGPVEDKLAFIKDYKFVLAFENCSYPGYTTEKIFDAMMVHGIPIYWGNPQISTDFNTQSFVNLHEYKNDEEVIKRIQEIDKDDNLYRHYLSQPYFVNNSVNTFVDSKNIMSKFRKIFADKDKIIPWPSRGGTILLYIQKLTSSLARRLNIHST